MAQLIDLTKIHLQVDRKSRYLTFEDWGEVADNVDPDRDNGSDEDEDEEEDEDGVKSLKIMIRGGQPTILGFISVYLIDRSKMRGKFWMIMDEPTEEISNFATTLFDNNGHLKQAIRGPQKGAQHGTGVFGKEMDVGPIAYLESLTISAKYRRQGVGGAAFAQLPAFLKVQTKKIFQQKLYNIFCWPLIIDHLERALPKDHYIIRSDQIIAFFRELGFRRVGRSKFFGYSLDPSHPSRALAAKDDAGGNSHAAEQEPNSPEFKAEYPLHHLLIFNKDVADIEKVNRILREAYTRDPSSLLKADPLGNNPLHVAACLHNTTLINGVLGLGEVAALVTAENAEGQTPIVLIQDELQGSDAFAEMFSIDRRQDVAYQKAQACIRVLRAAAKGSSV